MSKLIVFATIFSSVMLNGMDLSVYRLLKQGYGFQLKRIERPIEKKGEKCADEGTAEGCYLAHVPDPIAAEIAQYCVVNDMQESLKKKAENYYIKNRSLYKKQTDQTLFGLLTRKKDELLFTGPKDSESSFLSPLGYDIFEITDFIVNRNFVVILAFSQLYYDHSYNLIVGKVGQSMQMKNELKSIELSNGEVDPVYPFKIAAVTASKNGEVIVSLERTKEEGDRLVFRKKQSADEWKIITAMQYSEFELVKSMRLIEHRNELALLKKNNAGQFIKLPEQIKFAASASTNGSPQVVSDIDSYFKGAIVCKTLKNSKKTVK